MIRESRTQRVVTLTLDSPPVNILDTAMMQSLATALTRLAGDASIAALMIRGEGRCFSAGASVEEHDPRHARAMIGSLTAACEALRAFPAPVVALVHGHCLGGAMELIAFCDWVVSDPGACLGQPEIQLAFFPPLAAAVLHRIVGEHNASRMILSGETVDAASALRMGLIQKIVPVGEWPAEAERFNRLSAPVCRLAKRAVLIGRSKDQDAEERINRLFVDDLYRIEDVQEGLTSFLEKREPRWKHR